MNFIADLTSSTNQSIWAETSTVEFDIVHEAADVGKSGSLSCFE
jgi:hypothetical protein